MTGSALHADRLGPGCAESDVLAEGFKAMVTSPTKPLGDGSYESDINNSAATPDTLLRTPGPVASLSPELSDGPSADEPQQGDLRITDFLGRKCYLVTGITGFMGTVLAEKILREAPAGTKIYVPIRNAPRMTFTDRFWKKVLPRDFFNLLRKQKGADFETFIREHVTPFEADMDKPLLGIAPNMLMELYEQVEVIVHCAANTGFHVPLDEILATNTVGFMELLKIAAGCKRLKVCSTISTAYVHGGRPGVLPETAVAADEPPSLWHPLEPQSGGGDDGSGPAVAVTANGSQANGHSSSHSNGHANGHSEGHGGSRASVPGVFLDLESELAYAQEATARAREEAATSGLSGKELAKHDRKLRIAVGKARARQFGWHDSYTYSKALAELAAVRAAEQHGMPMLILRPTIVESAMREPAPGIIDSIACMEPLVFGYGRGAMDGFPMDPELPLDIVPVDTSINAILAALAATAGRPGVHVFQIGTSHCNPLVLKNLVQTLWEYLCKYPMRDDMNGDIVKVAGSYPIFYPNVPSFIASLQARHDSLLEGVDTSQPDGAALKDGLARALKFTRYLAEIYHPYTNYKGVFRADNLMALWDRVAPAERRRYPFALHQIDWEDYLFNTHLPGIRKYLLDEEEEDWAFNNDSTLTVGRNF